MTQRLLIAAMGLLIAISGNTQDNKSYSINASSVREVFISDDVEVILTAATAEENLLKIDKSVSADYTVYTSGPALHIYGDRNHFGKKKTIYLTVGRLNKLTIDGNVNLKTNGILQTGKLDLYVGGDSKAWLKTNGKVKVHSFGDAEVKYQMKNLSADGLISKKV
jgi:hypothetical protein